MRALGEFLANTLIVLGGVMIFQMLLDPENTGAPFRFLGFMLVFLGIAGRRYVLRFW